MPELASAEEGSTFSGTIPLATTRWPMASVTVETSDAWRYAICSSRYSNLAIRYQVVEALFRLLLQLASRFGGISLL